MWQAKEVQSSNHGGKCPSAETSQEREGFQSGRTSEEAGHSGAKDTDGHRCYSEIP